MAKRRFKARRRRSVKKGRKGFKGKKFTQMLKVKCEARGVLSGDSYLNGSDGCRVAYYWGSKASATVTNWKEDSNVQTPYETYEWLNWAGKFEEFMITGMKIKIQPGIQQGAAPGNNFHVLGTIGMGTSPVEIADGDEVTTNRLYQCNDFGTRGPDPSKPVSRFYGVAKSERRKFQPIWRSTRTVLTDGQKAYSDSVTYLNWECPDIGDNNAADSKIVGNHYCTWYIKFRRPRLDNINAE